MENQNASARAPLEQIRAALTGVSPFALVATQVPDTSMYVSVATDEISVPTMMATGVLRVGLRGADFKKTRSEFVREFRRFAATRRSGEESLGQQRLHETKPAPKEVYELWAQVAPDASLEEETRALSDFMHEATESIEIPAMIIAGVPESERTLSTTCGRTDILRRSRCSRQPWRAARGAVRRSGSC